MLRMNNLQANGWDLSDIKYVELTDKELANWKLESGDIVFNRTNSKELVGKCEVFREPGTWVFASYLMRLQVNEDEAIPEFVSAFLNGPTGRAQIDRESRQIIGMSNINAEEIRTLRVPLPNPSKQKTLLTALNSVRDEQRRKRSEVEALLASIDDFVLSELGLTLPVLDRQPAYAVRLKDARSRFDPDFHGPRFRTLRQKIESGRYNSSTIQIVCDFAQSGFAAGADDQTDDPTIGVPHIRPLNISDTGELHFNGTKMVPRSVLKPEDFLKNGEVLFNNTNSTAWVGKSVVFDADRECACSNHITRLRLRDDKDSPYFLAAILNALQSLGYFGLLSTNFNNQAGVNTQTLNSVRLPWPKPAIQSKLVEEIRHRRDEAHRLRSEAEAMWEAAKSTFEGALLGAK